MKRKQLINFVVSIFEVSGTFEFVKFEDNSNPFVVKEINFFPGYLS